MIQVNFSTTIIFFSGLLFSCACSNSGGNKTSASDAKTSSSTSATTSPDAIPIGRNGTFSYAINGQRVETRNDVQNANLFINEVSNDVADGIAKITVTCSGKDVFDFNVANSGTTSIDNRQPPAPTSIGKNAKAASYMDGKTARNLYAASVTLTITNIDNSRISGTFSGTYKSDESDGGITANITDGSFNLPFIKN